MKRAIMYLLCLAALPWLGGCNSIYSNYREIENLLVVRSVGFDREDGGTRFSLASSANDDGEPIRMTTKGGSITDAMERIRNYSSQEDIFYPHVEHILLGEDAARVSIEDYLAFFCRSPELRIDIPLYYRTLIILPLDHCFAHVVGFYIMIACGATVATVQIGRMPMETLKNIPVNIREVRPHFLLSVPALAKNFRKSIESSIRAKGRMTEGLFRLALKTAYAYNGDGYRRGRGWRCVLQPVVALFDVTLFRKVRKAFGGELRFFVGGGALLDAELQRFFYAVGMPMFQGYGLSEATPVISTNSPRPRKCRFGSSGTLVQPLDCRILDEEGREVPHGQRGQIVVRGENVMAGYWKNPEATADTVRDGWLHTGDMGYLTDDGFLYVLGRFKSLLIASDGEKYSPEGMEEAIADASRLIDQIIVHNNQNPYTVAIVVPNRDELRRRYQTCGNDLVALAREVAGEIDAFRAGGVHAGEFPDRWLPSAVAIVDEAFTEQNGLVNSTMKVVRSRVEEHFRDRLDALYTPEGKRPDSAQNLASLKKLVE